ncbi:MAG: alpha/beta fold hydrolase [Streptosporangiaceae bacterium]
MDFVLGHGTTQSPAGWDRLAEELTRRGHRVELVDLPVGQADLQVSDYARIAAGQVAGKVDRPVVVAHSGAGILLPALAAELDASHLVWLAAYVPSPDGRSYHEEVQESAGQMFSPEWRASAQSVMADPVVAAYFLFHDCDLASLRWGLSTLRAFNPSGAYREPAAARPPVPSTFVLPRLDRTLQPDWMRAAARQRLGVDPVEIDAGHCPHVSQPAVVAAILERIDRPAVQARRG